MVADGLSRAAARSAAALTDDRHGTPRFGWNAWHAPQAGKPYRHDVRIAEMRGISSAWINTPEAVRRGFEIRNNRRDVR